MRSGTWFELTWAYPTILLPFAERAIDIILTIGLAKFTLRF